MPNETKDIVPVYRSPIQRDLRDHVLVLRAAGIEFAIRREAGAHVLLVAPKDAHRAVAEIEAYAKENQEQSPVVKSWVPQSNGWSGVVVYSFVLVVVAILRNRETFGFEWLAAGKAHAGSIRDGQWWRTVTALTLHSDLRHLTGNIVFGSLFGLFAGQLLGSGMAWLLILIGGALGNLLNAWIHPPGHTSIGASTAVFATLGLVAAISWKRRSGWSASRLSKGAPIVAAVVLLSFLGTGGIRTDVLAHVTGFLAGLLLGALFSEYGERRRFLENSQGWLGAFALLLVAGAWTIAL